MNNIENVLLQNYNIQQQSQFKPKSDTFKFINESQERTMQYNLLNAIEQENTKCSQNVHN